MLRCGSPGFIDVASFGALSRYTCGQLYYYPGFHPDRDGARVEAEARPAPPGRALAACGKGRVGSVVLPTAQAALWLSSSA